MADINVTPLIDVVLVLLVVFMVITPMLQSGLPVDLPIATQTTTVNDVGQFIVVSITADEGVWVEQVKVSDDDNVLDADLLVAELTAQVAVNSERQVLVKADRNLPYKDVRAVMDPMAENRFTNILVAAGKEE